MKRFGSQGSTSLAVNSLWYLSATTMGAATKWGVLIGIAKLGNPADVGSFVYAVAATSPAFMFAGLGLQQILASDAESKYSTQHYLTLRRRCTLVAVGVMIAVAFILPAEYSLVVIAMCFAKYYESQTDILVGLFNRSENMKLAAIAAITKSPLILISAVLTYYFTSSVTASILAMGAARALAYYLIDLRLKSQLSDEPGKGGTLKSLLVTALPLGFVILFVSLEANLPRYFLETKFGKSALGGFAAVAYFPLVGSMIVLPISQVLLSRLGKLTAQNANRTKYRLLFTTVSGYLLLGLVGWALVTLFGEELIRLIYSEDYVIYKTTLLWLMVAAVFRFTCEPVRMALRASRNFYSQLTFQIINLLVLLACLANSQSIDSIAKSIAIVCGINTLLYWGYFIFTEQRRN